MSYKRTYRATAHYEGIVPYSGQVRYKGVITDVSSYDRIGFRNDQGTGVMSYEGNVRYSGEVPITYTVIVDTEPFDNSVEHCNNRISALNGAVVAMNGAQCAAIGQAADDVSQHVVDGFFNVVKSEISQDSARLRNIIISQIALLKDHAVRVRQQTDTMATDYNRISSRYIKIFKELDEECRKRVQSLDSKAFEISSEITEKQLRVPGMAIGGFITSSTEDCLTVDQIALSHLKSNTRDTINSLLDNISNDLRFSRNTERVTYEKTLEKGAEAVFVPVLFCQTDDQSGKHSKCYVNDTVARAPEDVCSEVNRYFSESEISWSAEGAVNANVDREFNALAEQVLDKRVYDEIMRLKGGARTETNQVRS